MFGVFMETTKIDLTRIHFSKEKFGFFPTLNRVNKLFFHIVGSKDTLQFKYFKCKKYVFETNNLIFSIAALSNIIFILFIYLFIYFAF